jgi:hypothetical protein
VATYAWTFPVNRFEMRILPNTRVFTGPYTPTTQTLDLLGERWMISLDMPPTNDKIEAARREAFFDRLKASANLITIGHQVNSQPLGTFGAGTVTAQWKNSSAANATWKNASAVTANWQAGQPVLAADIAQLANTGTIRTIPGRTYLAGSLFSMAGQLVRLMADALADGSGNMAIEFQPRARQFIPSGTLPVYSNATANFILKPGTPNVPTSWTPGAIDGATIEMIEVF